MRSLTKTSTIYRRKQNLLESWRIQQQWHVVRFRISDGLATVIGQSCTAYDIHRLLIESVP